MIVWLKLLHISALSIWCAGLLVLPGLYSVRPNVAHRHELFRLQKFTRYAFVVLVSPAAFVAIATGTGLIFARETFTAWFALKLALVGVLVLAHVRLGAVILDIFKEGRTYPPWRWAVVTTLLGVTVLGILVVVLGKPAIDLALVPAIFHEPGGLHRLAEPVLSRWMTR